MGEEVWKSIPGYTYYSVSNHGRIKSEGRYVDKGNHGKVWFPERILSQFIRSKYLCVNLYEDKKGTTKSVHSIVAISFVDNPDPVHKTQVNHIDCDKKNNHYKNLEWVTPKENTHHAIKTGVFCDGPKGSKNGMSVLTEEAVYEIKNSKFYGSRSILSNKFGVTIKHIDRIRSGERWGHLKGK